MGFIENTAMRHRRGGGGEVTVTSRLTDKKTKKYKRECRLDVRGGLEDLESGGEAQILGRPARDRGLPFPKTCEARVVA